jgi:hypothetical protein
MTDLKLRNMSVDELVQGFTHAALAQMRRWLQTRALNCAPFEARFARTSR